MVTRSGNRCWAKFIKSQPLIKVYKQIGFDWNVYIDLHHATMHICINVMCKSQQNKLLPSCLLHVSVHWLFPPLYSMYKFVLKSLFPVFHWFSSLFQTTSVLLNVFWLHTSSAGPRTSSMMHIQLSPLTKKLPTYWTIELCWAPCHVQCFCCTCYDLSKVYLH